MRVMVLENEPSSRRGGQELSLCEIGRGLAKRGHQISLLHVQEGDLLPKYATFCEDIIQVRGYSVRRSNLLGTAGALIRDILRVRRGLRREDPGIVYCNQFIDISFATIVARSAGWAAVCHLRLPAPPRWDRQQWCFRNMVDQYISVSEATRRGWVALGLNQQQVCTIHNGVDLRRFSPSAASGHLRERLGIPQAVPLLAYVGRLDRNKGIDHLLGAVALLRRGGVDCRLLIAGKALVEDDAYEVPLMEQARTLGVSDSVHFLGHVERPEEVLASADLSIVPSVWEEAFARTLMESMACATPVIGSEVGGIPEILDGEWARFLVPARNAPALAARIAEALTWLREEPDLGARCREHVRGRFSMERTHDAIEAKLSECVARRKLARRAACEAAVDTDGSSRSLTEERDQERSLITN